MNMIFLHNETEDILVSNSATELTKEDTRQIARRYLGDKAYSYVLGLTQAAKLRQVMKSVGVEGVTPRLMRDVMMESDRFETVDRRWAASVRYGDARRPLERILTDVIRSAGVPVKLDALAGELPHIIQRTPEYYMQALPRVLADKEKFFQSADGAYGLASWLIITTSEDEAGIIFDSFMSEEQVTQYSATCPSLTWDVDAIADSAVEIVKVCGPIPLKVLAILAWRGLGDDLDPVEFYSAVLGDERLLILSDQKVYPAQVRDDMNKALGEMAVDIGALPMEAEEEEADGPVTLTDTDKEEVISVILDRGSASAEELLDTVLEIGPGESAYAGTLEKFAETRSRTTSE